MPCFGYRIKAMPASLVAQMVKHLPAMQETGVRSLGREDSLEEEMATHSSVLAWEIPGQRSLMGYVHGVMRVGPNLRTRSPPPPMCDYLT